MFAATQLKVNTRGKDPGRDVFSVKGSKKGGLVARQRAARPPKRLVNLYCTLIQRFLPNRSNILLLPDALSISHETSLDLFIFHSSRTTIRIRCSRFTASSFEHNVCKGSRQIGSVRSQERVAHDDGELWGYE